MTRRFCSALIALALCFSFAGCTAAPGIPQPTLDELLAEVNAEHQSIQRGELDPTPYLRTSLPQEEWPKATEYETETYSDYDPNKSLTHDEAVEDVNYLFDACYYAYGLYDYFGGHETFDAARQAILHDLDGKDSMTCQQLEEIMVSHLGFIKDGHFSINNGERPNPWQVPFFYREVAFYKTEEGDYISEKGKRVASVDGYSDLDELFKRSISPEGEIVYYPVLLKELARTSQQEVCDETLTVRYANGSAQTLTAEPFQRYNRESEGNSVTEYYKDGEIPVFVLNRCDIAARNEIDAGAIMVARYPVGMVDLRANPGGSDSVSFLWLGRYTGASDKVFKNQYMMNVFTSSGLSGGADDDWIENDDRVLIVLTGTRIASAAETFVDMSHSVENVLFIGENTGGLQVASAAYSIQLPNSRCFVTMGNGLFTVPQDWDYYEEFRGYEPDLWVPAAEAEELAVRLMERLGAVGTPQD